HQKHFLTLTAVADVLEQAVDVGNLAQHRRAEIHTEFTQGVPAALHHRPGAIGGGPHPGAIRDRSNARPPGVPGERKQPPAAPSPTAVIGAVTGASGTVPPPSAVSRALRLPWIDRRSAAAPGWPVI